MSGFKMMEYNTNKSRLY